MTKILRHGFGGGVCPTLNAFDNTGESRATVLIIDGTRVDDVRVYEEPVQTLKERMDTGGNNVPMVAYPIQGTIIGRSDTAGPQGRGVREDGEPMYTLDSVSLHGVAASSKDEPAMQVRRLTPVECERLMGWKPDGHTLHRADGKENSDSTRYKMCGNGVASPVAQWIGEQIMEIGSTR